MRKVFLALEGGDGSGKSTIRKYIFRVLWENNQECMTVGQHSWCEPKYAEVIANIRNGRKMYSPEVISYAYLKDKQVHYNRTIAPQLMKRHVIADRYIYSDITYHEVLWGIEMHKTYERHIIHGTVQPDFIIFINTDPEVAVRRIKKRESSYRWWEKEDILRRIHEKYIEFFFKNPLPNLPPVYTINNTGKDEWKSQIDNIIEEIFKITINNEVNEV